MISYHVYIQEQSKGPSRVLSGIPFLVLPFYITDISNDDFTFTSSPNEESTKILSLGDVTALRFLIKLIPNWIRFLSNFPSKFFESKSILATKLIKSCHDCIKKSIYIKIDRFYIKIDQNRSKKSKYINFLIYINIFDFLIDNFDLLIDSLHL